mmetsp:Transcript_23257/g.46675  ORF Transcript_23257/g.46675 Transcript_23257/m.46675 type:complete len:259 (-) Transcript_23257:46-822(-)
MDFSASPSNSTDATLIQSCPNVVFPVFQVWGNDDDSNGTTSVDDAVAALFCDFNGRKSTCDADQFPGSSGARSLHHTLRACGVVSRSDEMSFPSPPELDQVEHPHSGVEISRSVVLLDQQPTFLWPNATILNPPSPDFMRTTSSQENGFTRSTHSKESESNQVEQAKSEASDGSPAKKSRRRCCPWTAEEHERFLTALEKFRTKDTQARQPNGKVSDGLGPGIAEIIAVFIGTRNIAQVRSHAQKHFQRMRKMQAVRS